MSILLQVLLADSNQTRTKILLNASALAAAASVAAAFFFFWSAAKFLKAEVSQLVVLVVARFI